MSKRHGKKKIKKIIKTKKKIRYFPIMFCINEDICIGVSSKYAKIKSDRFGVVKLKSKVDFEQWTPYVCKFRSEEYIIDLSLYKIGDEIHCPKCGSKIDFRLFPSSTPPVMVEIKND